MIGRGIRAFLSGLGGFILELGGILGPGVIRQEILKSLRLRPTPLEFSPLLSRAASIFR